MSRYIATRAIHGARALVAEAEAAVNDALGRHGPDTPVAFTNTAYYLPVIYAFTGQKVEKLGDLPLVIEHAKSLVHPVPRQQMWLPYLGETLDSGVATLFAEEAIEGVRFADGAEPQAIELDGDGHGDEGRMIDPAAFVHGGKMRLNGPIDDVQLRAWGIQLVDGRMPGFCAIVGCAKNNEVAVKIVRELQSRGILIFLSGNVNGRSIIHQLAEEGVQLGYDTFTVPFGIDTISAVYALGFAARSALTFGGMDAGQARQIMLYNKYRVFAFVLALGEVDDLKYATAAGAISFGFPTIADTRIPQILPTGVTTYEHVVAMPFDEIPGADDMERAEKLIQRCIEVRGVKVKISKVPIPVAYGSAFEGERVRKEQMRMEFGGRRGRAFEHLMMRPADEVEDGRITMVGPDLDTVDEGAAMSLGILVDVAGRKMQKDFEPIIERQFHYFTNGAEGIQHNGQRDITWIRVSKSSFDKGFRLEHLGKLLHARIHETFGNIVDKVQVKFVTDEAEIDPLLEEARATYKERNERIASLTDESVDTFYSCLLCQSFAPNHVCVVNPERVGLCGAYNWLDCRASFEINPTGPNQPVAKGVVIDPVRGEFSGPNEYVYQHSNQTVDRVTFYSAMEAPMTSCGCFECIMVIVPEANGFMVVSREDPSMTPCGMTFSTLAGTAGGGMQTPGMMGFGKYYLTSRKFISADGGLRRIVWMSSILKQQMEGLLEPILEEEGVPDLLDRIADETVCTDVDGLLPYLEEKQHPALTMDPLF
jgi:acetyl-CoA synthase